MRYPTAPTLLPSPHPASPRWCSAPATSPTLILAMNGCRLRKLNRPATSSTDWRAGGERDRENLFQKGAYKSNQCMNRKRYRAGERSWARYSGTVETVSSVAVPRRRRLDFAPKRPEQEKEINDRQDDADAPPYQADLKTVTAGRGILDRDVEGRVERGAKQIGVIARHCGRQDAQQKQARGQESRQLAALPLTIEDANQTDQHQDRQNQGPRPGPQVGKKRWIKPGCGQCGQHPQRYSSRPCSPGKDAAPLLHRTGRFPDQEQRPVAGQHT